MSYSYSVESLWNMLMSFFSNYETLLETKSIEMKDMFLNNSQMVLFHMNYFFHQYNTRSPLIDESYSDQSFLNNLKELEELSKILHSFPISKTTNPSPVFEDFFNPDRKYIKTEFKIDDKQGKKSFIISKNHNKTIRSLKNKKVVFVHNREALKKINNKIKEERVYKII